MSVTILQQKLVNKVGPLRRVVWDIDKSHSLVLLCGPQGAGKSTFINVLARALRQLFANLIGGLHIDDYDDNCNFKVVLDPTTSLDKKLLGRKRNFSFPSNYNMSSERQKTIGSLVPFSVVRPLTFGLHPKSGESYRIHGSRGYLGYLLWLDDKQDYPIDPVLYLAAVLDFIRRPVAVDLPHQVYQAKIDYEKTMHILGDISDPSVLISEMNKVLIKAVDLEIFIADEELISIRRPSTDILLACDRLSDGERYAIGLLLAGLIMLPSNGILLIDSIETYLHPAAQVIILEAIISRLTYGQIILATHSPSILATRPFDEIYLIDHDKKDESPVAVNHEESIKIIRNLYGDSTCDALVFSLSNYKSHTILAYLLECCLPPTVAIRKDGDPQMQQMAMWISGYALASKREKLRVVDVGAGNGDLLKAIRLSGQAENICYTPIEIDETKWDGIEQLCKSIEGLEYDGPHRNISDIVGADIVFIINMLHELDLESRAKIISGCLKLTQKSGFVVIHEVSILPVGEKEFVVWDNEDIQSIFEKVEGDIDIHPLKTYTRPSGLPLDTICMTCTGQPIDERDIYRASILALEEIWLRWTSMLGAFVKDSSQTDFRYRYKAFLMAQVAHLSVWMQRFRDSAK